MIPASIREKITPTWYDHLYSITVEDDSQFGNWEGTVTQIKKFVEQSTERSRVSLEKKIKALTERVMEGEIRESSHDREIKGSLKKLDSMSRKLRKNLDITSKKIDD